MLLNTGILSAQMILILVIFIWLAVVTFILLRAVRHYSLLIAKVKKGDLKAILEEILSRVEKQSRSIEKLEERAELLEKDSLDHLQKVGFVRFNPFSDTGGDQSFSLSLLDGKDNGVIFSSLHSRGHTRIYAKEVAKGAGKGLELSREEVETIKRAKKGKS